MQANGQRAKPTREVRVGDMLRVTTDGGDYEIEALLLSEVRGAATVAVTLYRETDASLKLRRRNRDLPWHFGDVMPDRFAHVLPVRLAASLPHHTQHSSLTRRTYQLA